MKPSELSGLQGAEQRRLFQMHSPNQDSTDFSAGSLFGQSNSGLGGIFPLHQHITLPAMQALLRSSHEELLVNIVDAVGELLDARLRQSEAQSGMQAHRSEVCRSEAEHTGVTQEMSNVTFLPTISSASALRTSKSVDSVRPLSTLGTQEQGFDFPSEESSVQPRSRKASFMSGGRWSGSAQSMSNSPPLDRGFRVKTGYKASVRSNEGQEFLHSNSNMPDDVMAEMTIGPKADDSEPPRCMLRPSSTRRLIWDTLGMVLIVYDIMAIPVQLAFDPPSNIFTEIMTWVSICFWTMDIFLSCITGYYSKGAEEMRPRKIISRYASTWLTFDILIVLSDLVTWLSNEGRFPALARFGKSVRVLRVIRSVRLLRLVKVKKFSQRISDQVESEHVHLFVGMMKGTVFVLCMNHIIACVWYGIGNTTSSRTWVSDRTWDGDTSIAYKYVTSLHWSLAQFTPASMEVNPTNTIERTFTVVIILYALLVFSSFLSSITAAMTQLRQMSWRHDKNLWLLRKYLRIHRISAGLSLRILKYVEYRLLIKKREIRQSDVHLLGVLSTQLRMELVQESYQPILGHHPFLHRYAMQSPEAMREICNKGVTPYSYSVGDTVFARGSIATGPLFLIAGQARYKKGQRRKKSHEEGYNSYNHHVVEMEVGEWCSEASLWTDWTHVGSLQAVQNSELMILNAEQFLETSRMYHVWWPTMRYANNFVEFVNSQVEDGTLTDLFGLDAVMLESMVTMAFWTEESMDEKQLNCLSPKTSRFKGFWHSIGTGSEETSPELLTADGSAAGGGRSAEAGSTPTRHPSIMADPDVVDYANSELEVGARVSNGSALGSLDPSSTPTSPSAAGSPAQPKPTSFWDSFAQGRHQPSFWHALIMAGSAAEGSPRSLSHASSSQDPRDGAAEFLRRISPAAPPGQAAVAQNFASL